MDARGSTFAPSLRRLSILSAAALSAATRLALVVALTTQVAFAGQLQLTWVDNSGGQAAFQIERKVNTDTTYTTLVQQPAGVAGYADGTVTAGITYCYRVQAYDDAGVSPYSNEACGSVATGLALTVSRGGTGQGTVSSNPAGISCGTDCVETYPTGTVVTLSAIAASGSTFDGWSGGGCAGSDPCTLIGNAPVTVAATFTAAPPTSYPLSVTESGPGAVTSSPAGINCGADCSESYVRGTIVSLMATPANGARFLGWTGACSGTGACSVTLTAASTVSATFSKAKGRK
jgi:List-Bact-rpt repeat protein